MRDDIRPKDFGEEEKGLNVEISLTWIDEMEFSKTLVVLRIAKNGVKERTIGGKNEIGAFVELV